MADIGEIICDAVDTIVNKKLEGLKYDITKLCTIVDDSGRLEGRYMVSDGSVKFEAFSTVTQYSKGNSVLVNIPNGDYNMQKTIVGRQTALNTQPFNYVSPIDTMIRFKDNQIVGQDNPDSAISLLANGRVNSKLVYTKSNVLDGLGYTRLGVTADFKSLLSETNIREGTYGLKILLYSYKTNKDNEAEDKTRPQTAVYELTLNNSDMYGNPYAYENYFSQEKVFDISEIDNINEIEIYFYQSNNFIDNADARIESTYELESEILDLPDNLFVNNVNLFLGYDKGRFTDESLTLYTPNTLGYWHYNEENDKNKKEIYLRWVHKIDDYNYCVIDDNNKDDYGNFKIEWFKYDASAEVINKYAGIGWKNIENTNDKFSIIFEPNLAEQEEQIKAIGYFIPKDTEDEKIYYSSIIKFTNLEDVPDAVTVNATTALSIKCEDGTDGNYFLYDQNGKLMNDGEGRQKVRKLTALFNGSKIDSSIGVLNYLQWYIPVATDNNNVIENNSSMLHPIYGEKVKIENNYPYKGTTYSVITLYPIQGEGDELFKFDEQGYYIKNFWTPMKSNNTIMCKLKMNGIIYTAEKELNFGRAGSNGTNLTLTLDFAFGCSNAIEVEQDEYGNIIDKSPINIEAHLYDIKGNDLEFSKGEDSGCLIEWAWYKDNGKMDLAQNKLNPELCQINLKDDINSIPIDNYQIVKCSYKTPNGVTLEAYLPIPVKNKEYAYIEGAKEIVYNHQSESKYYSDAYKLYDIDQKEIMADWRLETTDNIYAPTLKEIYVANKVYKGMSASPFYIKDKNDEVCVYCQIEGKTIWSQPVLIMQGQYDFALLNDWDGKLTLDDNNGTILSTMLGAGKKNDQNQFSGVLIGDVQGGTGLNDTETLTGVYGFDKGVMSYALREDGTALFGKKGSGQIRIDGNESTIKSAGYLPHQKGTLIDMDDGIIEVNGKNGGSVLIQPDKEYVNIKDKSNNYLLKISDNDYYLQSGNFTDIGVLGSNLNLSNGFLDIRSQYGRTYFADGNGTNPFLEISVPSTSSGIANILSDYSDKLMYIGSSDFYLQSKGYVGQVIRTQTISYNGKNINCNVYKDEDNKESYLEAYTNNNKLEYNIYQIDSNGNYDIKQFEEKTIQVDSGNDQGQTIKIDSILTAEQVKDMYISQLIPQYTSSNPTGLNLDLKNGRITGYDLFLKGVNKQGKGYLTIDSSAEVYPLNVNNNFKVNWDGTLNCNKVNSLNNDGRNEYAISIGNSFYVTSSGSAGGGTWNGNSTGVSGYGGRSIPLSIDGSNVTVLCR